MQWKVQDLARKNSLKNVMTYQLKTLSTFSSILWKNNFKDRN